jgi:hypothetical protein
MSDDDKQNPKSKSKQPYKLPGGVGFHRVKNLKCFPEVRERLADGWSLGNIADLIQKEHDEYTDITKQSLVSILHRYRKSIPPGELARKAMPAAIQNAVLEVSESLDEIKALKDLYDLQIERIKIDFGTEKKIGKLLGSLTQDIRTLREIVESSAKLKSDKGLIPKNLGTMTHEIQGGIMHADVSNVVTSKVLEDPQSRSKVLSLMQKFMNQSSKIDMDEVNKAMTQLPQEASKQIVDLDNMDAEELLKETEQEDKSDES